MCFLRFPKHSGGPLQWGKTSATYTVQTTPNAGAIPCFAQGTLIATPGGAVPVEDLTPGMMITTVDHGPQPLRWIGAQRINAGRLSGPEFDPVMIRQGALGGGLPSRDLFVSVNHRILIAGAMVQLHFGTDEVLAEAGSLIGLPGITRAFRPEPFAYFHLAFDRHEVIVANGVETESLLVGAHCADLIGPAGFLALRNAMPDRVRHGQTAARRVLRHYETLLLARMMRRDDRPQAHAA